MKWSTKKLFYETGYFIIENKNISRARESYILPKLNLSRCEKLVLNIFSTNLIEKLIEINRKLAEIKNTVRICLNLHFYGNVSDEFLLQVLELLRYPIYELCLVYNISQHDEVNEELRLQMVSPHIHNHYIV